MLGDIQLAIAARSWRFRQSAEFVVRRHGCAVPISKGLGYNLLPPPDEKLAVVVKSLQGREGYFIDAGANQGQALVLLAHLGIRRAYLGFEPNPDSANYVLRLIEVNGWSDASVVPVALGSDTALRQMAFNHRGDESATLSNTVRPPSMYSGSFPVPVVRADDMLVAIDKVCLFKVDCEGFEPEVFEGARRFIELRHPPVYFEVLGYGHLESGAYPRDYFGELSQETVESICEARRDNCLRLDSFFQSVGYQLHFVTAEKTIPVDSIESCLPGTGDMDFLALPR